MQNSDKLSIKTWDEFSGEFKDPDKVQALELGVSNDQLLVRLVNTNQMTLNEEQAKSFIAKAMSIYRRIWSND